VLILAHFEELLGYRPLNEEVEGEPTDEDCEFPQFLEDSRGLHSVSPVLLSRHDFHSMGPLMWSLDDPFTPAIETSLPEEPARQDNSSPFRNSSPQQAAASKDVTERKNKRKKNEAGGLGFVAHEEDWRNSVKTRGQLRMILEPVVLKRDPEVKASPSRSLEKDPKTVRENKDKVSEIVLTLSEKVTNCSRLLMSAPTRTIRPKSIKRRRQRERLLVLWI